MKKLLAIILILGTILTALPALAADVEANTLVAKIDGEMVTMYLSYADKYEGAIFETYDENGKCSGQLRIRIITDTKTGTYEGFNNKNIYGMWYNTNYKRDIFGEAKSYDQYMGADYSGVKNIVGGSKSDLARWKSNQGDIVLKLTKATGYRFIGEFSAVLHDTKKDELIPIQGKFDYTIGEKYEAPAKNTRKDHGLSLDDIDF